MSKKNSLDLTREDLVSGDLCYLFSKITRQKKTSEHVTLWSDGPQAFLDRGWDRRVGIIWTNEYNPFMVLNVLQDEEIDTSYWYQVLTKDGKVGWFCLDDGDMDIFHLSFRKAIIPSQQEETPL
jgi:hypothetical protein